MKSLNEIKDIKWPKRKDDPFKVETIDRNSRDWISLEWLSTMNQVDDAAGKGRR